MRYDLAPGIQGGVAVAVAVVVVGGVAVGCSYLWVGGEYFAGELHNRVTYEGNMIAVEDMNVWEIIFSHVDDDTGENNNIAVGRLIPHVAGLCATGALEVIWVSVEQDIAKYFRTNRGIEEVRLNRLPNNSDAVEPILFACMPDQTHLLVDGHHRYVKAASLGAKHIKAVLVPELIWRKFQIVGLKPVNSATLRVMQSGII